MAQLTNSEKRLLYIFGGFLFLALNGAGIFWVSSVMKGITTQQEALTKQKASLSVWSARAGEATSKRTWLDKHLSVPASATDLETYLDAFIKGEAQQGLNLELTKGRPSDTKSDEYFTRSSYEGAVKGKWKDVGKFIFRLQKPEELRFAPLVNLKTKKSEGTDIEQDVECEFRIEKWWDPRAASEDLESLITDEQPAAAAVESPADGEKPVPAPEGKPANPPAPAVPAPPAAQPVNAPANSPVSDEN